MYLPRLAVEIVVAEGYAAFVRGTGLDENPYHAPLPHRDDQLWAALLRQVERAWAEGWHAARQRVRAS